MFPDCGNAPSVIATYNPPTEVGVTVRNEGDCKITISLGSVAAAPDDRGKAVADANGDKASVSATKVGHVTIACSGGGRQCKYTYSIKVG